MWSQLLGGSEISAQDRYIDDWLKGIERDYLTATGLRVGVADARTVPGISACINVLSDDLAKVPLDLKRRTEDGLEPAVEHPLHALLKFGPAPWLSPYTWRRTLVDMALAHGNGCSRVYRSERGVLDRLAVLQHGSVTPRWADDGEPFFDVATQTGMERGLTWQDVIHVPYRASNDEARNGGTWGVSPLIQNRETVAVMLATERFTAKFFANGARPSAVIEMPGKLANKEVADRIRAGIERVYAGADNAFKIAVLELGMTIKEFSSNPSDSQLLETRKEQAVQACTMYRVPPHKIGILDRATFSNIEHQGLEYVTGPVSAMAKCIESAIAIACLTPAERELYKVEHNLEGLMRGDILSRYRAHAIGRQWGWLSADDVRETENRNALPNGVGKSYLVPMNMTPAGEDPMKDDPAEPKPGQRAAQPDWSPVSFAAVDPTRLNGARHVPPRLSALTGPAGEPLYLNGR
jgi:HK97 family phage portal protein